MPLRAEKMPRSRAPLLTLKPTAFGSLLEGNATAPVVMSSVAPLPTNSVAWLTATASNSPFSKVFAADESGSSTPVTLMRLTWMTALP